MTAPTTPAPTKAPSAKRTKKVVESEGIAHISATFNNLLITITDMKGNTLAWGSAGTMLAAQVMWERAGGDAWVEAWRASADWLWDEWRGELWRQELAGKTSSILGPAHGLAGNVLVLARGDLLDPSDGGSSSGGRSWPSPVMLSGTAPSRSGRRRSRRPGVRRRSGCSGATARRASSRRSPPSRPRTRRGQSSSMQAES